VKAPIVNIFLLLSLPVFCQEYNYVHYDTKDGLAGSTVYRMYQDKKGYMWFATDNGVSRFDGITFKNFTTENGLTDNEVLFISGDSKDRIWMMPFNKTVSYYYKGKIHNSENDSSLKKITFSSFGIMAGENNKGEVYLMSVDGIFLYKNNGELKTTANYMGLAKKYGLGHSVFLPIYMPDQPLYRMLIYNTDHLFYDKNDSFVLLKRLKNSDPPSYLARITNNLDWVNYKKLPDEKFTSSTTLDRNYTLYNTINGSWLLDSNGMVDDKPFLPGKNISHSLMDSEGNMWFSTLGEGVFRLTTTSVKTYSPGTQFFSIQKISGKIYAGTDEGHLHIIDNSGITKKEPFRQTPRQDIAPRLYTIKSDRLGNIYLGFDSYLVKYSGQKQVVALMGPIKSIDIVDDKHIVVCTSSNTLKLRSSDLKMVENIWPDRGTKVIYDRGYYYIGTLKGLVIIDTNKIVQKSAQDNPLLTRRIVDMCKMPDGSLWIASNDNGILIFKNGKITSVINKNNGLNSDICKALFTKGNYLWVGTNKGINKIDITNKQIIKSYSTSDGLASDIVNAIYSDDSIIWVCSPAGLTYFKEQDVSDSSICKLDLHSVFVSGKNIDQQNIPELPYKDNNISFEYAAISFKSAGDVVYRYKLKGLNNSWEETRFTTLSYPSLPAGEYELQLYAVNKFGKHSDTAIIHFTIAAPFWGRTWFWIIFSVMAVGITWYLLSRRYRRLQRRMKEKNDIARRMTELEQASLRAQMNPHFIFNCLNSIQHFVLKNDMEQTNRYITQFGSLIRQTLDNSARINITIADEINYLTSYMELEQMRFVSRFHYTISLDPAVHADYTYIPSMLLQPFVENAIRHGIRHKEGDTGLISIIIRETPHGVIFTIEDNGVGREAAGRYKSQQHIEYQSKGITLAQNRLEILSAGYPERITTEIIDLKDETGNAAGTKVVITFPKAIIEKLN
jgi:hypothetical protein